MKRFGAGTAPTLNKVRIERFQVYANIGYFFANKDIVTVLVNHQMVPNVVYPEGANDIQRAREWIYENISKDVFGNGSPDKVFLFGHSSGGAHIAMNLYAAGM